MKKYLKAGEIKLVHSGGHYFEVLEELINNSKTTLHIQTYIFEADETGTIILDAIKNAATRGVSVFLMLDAFGSFSFPSAQKDTLRASGVHFRFFSPFLSSENRFLGRRMHHKIAVADKYNGLITGINIANKYNSNKGLAWLDFGVQTKGEVNEYLHLLCEQFYHRKRISKLPSWESKFESGGPVIGEHLLRFRRNDWLRRHNEIHRSYVEAITKAKVSIVIVASYFLPGANFRNLLRNATKRGVEIKIILAGKSDLPSVRHAESYLLGYYLKNSIQIYEWKESVMHGKAMIVDSKWATLGSYNLNFLSHYFSTELNADVIDPEFIKTFSRELADIAKNHCTAIDLNKYQNLNKPARNFVQWLAYNFFRLVMNMMMFGSKFRRKTGH